MWSIWISRCRLSSSRASSTSGDETCVATGVVGVDEDEDAAAGEVGIIIGIKVTFVRLGEMSLLLLTPIPWKEEEEPHEETPEEEAEDCGLPTFDGGSRGLKVVKVALTTLPSPLSTGGGGGGGGGGETTSPTEEEEEEYPPECRLPFLLLLLLTGLKGSS